MAHQPQPEHKRKRVVLLTGFPGFLGNRIAEKILSTEPETQLYTLTLEESVEKARQQLAAWDPGWAARTTLFIGDVSCMDIGLSGDEIQLITREVTDIYHLAGMRSLEVFDQQVHDVNVGGTREVLHIARECDRLVRFNHFSTCHVSGKREGVIQENELDVGQRFRSCYEQTKFLAEQMVLAEANTLPVTVFRPSIVVGDSRSVDVGKLWGIYHIGALMVALPVAIPLPLRVEGGVPLNIVPLDYVVDASYAISLDPRGIGRTFHIVDPNPVSSRRVYEIIAERSGRRVPRVSLNYSIARMLLGLPGIKKRARTHLQSLDFLNHIAIYSCANTLELLAGTGIACLRFEEYVDDLLHSVRRQVRSRGVPELQDVEDPLDA